MSDILAGFVPIEQFAKDVGRTTRTVLRWMDEDDGLPYSRLGSQRLIHQKTARRWLLDRMHWPNPSPNRRKRRRR